MKNLLLIFVFVLISLTGFSQTFTLSSSTVGQTQQTYTISTPTGKGFGYIYNLSATHSYVAVIVPTIGALAVLNNTAGNLLQSYGYGEYGNPYHTSTMQIVIQINNMIGYSGDWGYAQIYVFPRL
jgi:hypothetical protein